MEQILDLGFGRCRLQVQTPEKDEDLNDPRSLIGKEVCTSFMGLTEQYFARLEEKKEAGLTNGDVSNQPRSKLRTQVRRLNGSVEAACALGVAAGIVDLVGKPRECMY